MKFRIRISLTLALVSASFVSCVYDDFEKTYSDCGRLIEVRSLGGDDSKIGELVVYIYDSGGKLIGYQTAAVATPFRIDHYQQYGDIKVVVWGNSQSARHTLSQPTLGSSLSDHRLVLNPSTENFADYSLTMSPADIFYGATQITFNEGGVGLWAHPDRLVTANVDRVVSSYKLTVKHVGLAFANADNDYQVVVITPKSELGFDGSTIDGQSIYRPKTNYNATSDLLTTDIELSLPTSDRGIVIQIYSAGSLVYTANVDDDNKLMSLFPNKLHNILIDLMGESDVVCVASTWGDALIWQEF